MTTQQNKLAEYFFNIMKPKPTISGAEWADKYFYLSAESSSLPGKWITRPYQAEIINAMTDIKSKTVVIKKATRIGYNKMLNIMQGYFIHQQPSVILFYAPTTDEARGTAEDEIEPMIRDNPEIAKLVDTPNVRGRVKKEKTIKKMYPGGYLEVLGAESDRNFNRRTARVVIGDEVDTWKKEAGKAGDTVTTMMRRSQDFEFRKNVLGGKPVGAEYDTDKEMDDGVSVIDYWFKKGTQEHRYLPCLECGFYQTIEFEDFKWDKDKDENGKTIKHYPNSVHVECKNCKHKITHKEKREMDKRGKWVAHGDKDSDVRSFHVWAALSYSPNVTWADIVKEFLDAKNSRLKMKAFTSEVLARTWEDDYESADTSEMLERLEEYTAQVPDGVLVLTFGADVQKDRIECEVIGWGAKYESWAIEYKIFYGDTTQPEVWETLREYILTSQWYRDDGETMSIYCGCIDAGYLTNIVTEFCAPLFSRRIYATKGMNSVTARMIPRFSSKTKKDKRTIFSIGVNKAKDEIAWMIASMGGAGFMHFPYDNAYDEEYFKQLGAEKRDKLGRWIKIRARNEVLDIRVYNYVSIFLAGLDLEMLSHRGAITNEKKAVRASGRRILSKGIRK